MNGGFYMLECPKCGEYRFNTVAVCRCKVFKVIDEDGEEHAVHAMDEEGAALKYAERSNTEGDYYLMNESAEISVNGKKFRISAEPDVHYSANEVRNSN